MYDTSLNLLWYLIYTINYYEKKNPASPAYQLPYLQSAFLLSLFRCNFLYLSLGPASLVPYLNQNPFTVFEVSG